MKRFILLILLPFLLAMLTAFFPSDHNFNKKWKKVKSFQQQGLPKSALKLVEEIEREAERYGDYPNMIKAIIYQASLKSTFEEDNLLHTIQNFEKVIKKADFPEKQILFSLTAELYQHYFTKNKWKILEIKVSEQQTDDITVWDTEKFHKKITDYYLKSLQPADALAKIKLNDYAVILNNLDRESMQYRQTLYDLLADRAIRYFSSTTYDWGHVKNTKSSDLNKSLLPAKKFLKLSINDSTPTGIILKLYQQLLKKHYNDKNPAAFVDIDLKRLQFVYNQLPQTDENQKLYLKILEQLYNDVKNLDVSYLPAIALAQQYEALGNRYNPFDKKSESYRYYKVKARDLCKNVLKKFPDARFAGNCKNIISRLENPAFSLTTEKVIVPEKPALTLLSFKNTTTVYLKVVKINNPDKFFISTLSSSRRKEIIENNAARQGVYYKNIDLPDTKDLQQHNTEIILPGLASGVYLLLASDSSDFLKASTLKYELLTVTSLSLINSVIKDQNRFWVVNREKGKPEKNVHGTVFKMKYHGRNREYANIFEFVTDAEGFAVLPKNSQPGNVIIKLIKNENILYSSDYLAYFNTQKPRPAIHIYLFTDRSIYRPGQTVYFKGIVVRRQGNDVSIEKNYKTEITFKNANYQKVSSLQVKTNEFGSFHGAFIIPAEGLNGTMQLHTAKGSVNFSVENYKRPAFKVLFDTIKNTFKLGDSITIPGKAVYFNGTPVAGAKVSYRIVRSTFYPFPLRYFMPYPKIPEEQIVSGETTANENGIFNIRFKAQYSGNTSVRFTCYVDVKDITGEVQAGQTTVNVTTKDLWVKISAPENLNKKDDSIEIMAVNSSGHSIPVSGTLQVYRLIPPKQTFIERYWHKPDIQLIPENEFKKSFPHIAFKNENITSYWPTEKIMEKPISFTGKQVLSKKDITALKPGIYKWIVKINNETDSVITTIFDPYDNHIASREILWNTITGSPAEPQDTVNTVIATAEKNTLLLYQVTSGKKIIEEKKIRISEKQITIPFVVTDELRGGFAINIISVKHNRIFTRQQRIAVPYTNKKLILNLETFRDHLTPGNREKWKVSITGYDKNPVNAELMAVMYDASLDAIKQHSWQFALFFPLNNHIKWNSNSFGSNYFISLRNNQPKWFNEHHISYPQINWFGLRFNRSWDLYRYAQAAPETVNAKNTLDDGAPKEKTSPKKEIKPETTKTETQNKTVEAVIRSDFRETAFFYPQLQTDNNGETYFEFTVPDALTEWKMMMLAHTPDLKSGIKTYRFKAYKNIMILPNTPRFVRQNDKLEFAARLVNNSNEEQHVKVNIEFSDAITNEKLNLFLNNNNAERIVKLAPKESKKINWLIHIPENISLLQYKIIANTANFSDGEQRLIPVLPDRKPVIETFPIFIKKQEDKTFVFGDFIKKSRQKEINNLNFTLEFTTNPAWYAIQSLPYLNQPQSNNLYSLFNTFFANALAGYIVNSSPRIKTVFDTWKNQSPEAFLSQLQKNKELKSVVLEETPWVLEAQNQTEQKRRIALLFDLNNLNNQKHDILNKLQQSQLPSGAWPWFKGMREDRFTTLKIVTGIARLIEKRILNFEDPEINRITKKAVYYLDKKQQEKYEKLKNKKNINLNDKHISTLDIQYLYTRSLMKNNVPVSSENIESYKYYLNQANKYKLDFGNYFQALTAVILFKNNLKENAQALLRSIKERSLTDKNGGMYWRKEYGWQWYKAPVETEVAVLEAFNKTGFNTDDIEKMKIWLLEQKRTQHWATNSATAEAVYALLLTGDHLLENDNPPLLVIWGDDTLNTAQSQAGTGYFKISKTGNQITPELGKITVKNSGQQIAWGAAYWQYTQKIDKVTSSGKGFTVKKELFYEDYSGTKTILKNNDKQHFKIGDKVYIRLIIKNEQDIEFVTLKDDHGTGMEVLKQLSGYEYHYGLGFYRNNKDASTIFNFRYLPKGSFVIEYPVYLTQKGVFPVGIASLQSIYAPEFSAHSKGFKITVD